MTTAKSLSQGRYANIGNGPQLYPVDIGHDNYTALVSPDTAFWSLVRKDKVSEVLAGGKLLTQYQKKSAAFAREIKMLRFGLRPTAVYFNPTERCNLNCNYCYIPENMRSAGKDMKKEDLLKALAILKTYFNTTMPKGSLPQIVFHSSEPLLNRDAVFAGIEEFQNDFRFGVQTNGTLLDDETLDFLTSHGVGIGLSLDGHIAEVADRTRHNWVGDGSFAKVISAIERLKGYPGYNVICTVTSQNMKSLNNIVDFFHDLEIPVCMLNPVRCTRQGARDIKPDDAELARYYLAALDHTYELYKKTGRKLVVANFANALIGIIAPTARRLMCDISPCGGGRCFFALSANGEIFPCSEFVGIPDFAGGNIFTDNIESVFSTKGFTAVTERNIEHIEPCRHCAVRHFCGAPCPAEAYEMNGSMNKTGAFCELYEEQVRYAMRLIADAREEAFLWDGWDSGTTNVFNISTHS